jgi:hypothetical protein
VRRRSSNRCRWQLPHRALEEGHATWFTTNADVDTCRAISHARGSLYAYLLRCAARSYATFLLQYTTEN